MKVRIKHLLIYLPPGSTAVIEYEKTGMIIQGTVEKIGYDRVFEITLSKASLSAGSIDYQNRNYLDPKTCAKTYGESSVPVENYRMMLDKRIIGICQYGRGIFRVQCCQVGQSVICFPKPAALKLEFAAPS